MYIKQIGLNYIHNEFFKGENPNGCNCYTLIILKTPAIFKIKNVSYTAKKNSIIIYESLASQFYYAAGEALILDRIQFGFENDFNFLKSLKIRTNTVMSFKRSESIDEILKLLLNEFNSSTPRKNEFIDCMLKALLLKISESVNTDSPQCTSGPYYNKLLEMRKKIYSNPSEKWTVELLSREVNLSRSYFQLLYRETFGITCISDVIECKINLAKASLVNTSNTISRIAEACGYDNDVHFMRQFKKIVGITPSEYRRLATVDRL